jgi:hypothetical protein
VSDYNHYISFISEQAFGGFIEFFDDQSVQKGMIIGVAIGVVSTILTYLAIA